MASNRKDVEPLCNVTVLKTKRVLLVENVLFENVMPCIIPFLIFRQVDTIYGEKTKGDRIGKILDILERLTNGKQYNAFNAFFKALGGTQPEIFDTVVGRAPTDSESEFCIRKFAYEMKENIKGTGHCTDSKFDEEIDLTCEHVQLSVVDRSLSEVAESAADGQLPHEYQQHLTGLQDRDRNISISDILGDEDKPHKKVLIFGRAGIGKSTTFQWLSKEWALGRWGTGFTLLFLLQLRSIMNPGISVSCVELLAFYGLYQLQDDTDITLLFSWLQNSIRNVIILLDGLDEIPGFMKRMMHTPKITNPLQKAPPLDICINLIKGNLLPGCTVITASRPFVGLNEIPTDSKAEILGLTSVMVTEYVERKHPRQAIQILSALQQNPILLSACSITFYCMMITRLMSEGVALIDEEVQTYTGLMAFILIQYTTRKLPDSGFLLEVSDYFPKLAKLAYRGIFESAVNKGLPKLVFDEDDLVQADIRSKDLESLRESGILQIGRRTIGQKELITAEFFHLTVQELLAVSYFLSVGPQSNMSVDEMLDCGQFDMCVMYMFGLQSDQRCSWIRKVRSAVSSAGSCHGALFERQLSSLLDNLSTNGDEGKLKMCQLIHEGQRMEEAERMAHHVVSEGELSIEHTTMTAIDLLAVDFVCRCAGPLNCIKLYDVNADASFVNVMLSSLYIHHLQTVLKLDLNHNRIQAEGAKAIAKMLASNTSITELDISHNEIGDIGAEAIAQALANNTSLKWLNIAHNEIGVIGAKAIAETLASNTSLAQLNISHNHIGSNGAKAIAETLANNNSLTELNISNTQIGASGAKAIAEMIRNNNSLTKLEITYSEMRYIGAAAIAQILASGASLQLIMTHNGIDNIL